MKHIGNNMKYSPAPRRTRRNETRAWPIVRFALLAVGVLALAAVLVLFGVPHVRTRLAAREEARRAEEAAEATPAETPYAPNPLSVNPASAVTFAGVTATVAIDPCVNGESILFAAGDDADACDRLVRYFPASGACEEIALTLRNDCVRHPAEDAYAMAYLDVSTGGGGRVMWMDRADGVFREIARFAAGVPRLRLEYPYLAWTARTSDGAASLYVFDAVSGETAAIETFDGAPYAFSAPSLRSGQLLYADASEKGDGKSRIRTILLSDGTRFDYEADLYVHDPVSNGNRWAFLSGDHGPDADLYLCTDGGAPRRIAHGAIDFAITPSCLVFCRDETVFAYSFDEDKTYLLNETGTSAQLVTAGGGYVVWRDVSDPESPAYRIMRLV